jgi:hypothetical protein
MPPAESLKVSAKESVKGPPPAKHQKKDGKEGKDKDKKKDKAKDFDPDSPMPPAAASSASGAKRAAMSDSESDGLGGPLTPPKSGSDPVTEDMLTRMFDKLTSHVDNKLTHMQELNDSHFATMSQGFEHSLKTLAGRVEANESESRLKFETIEANMAQLHELMKAPPPPPSASAAASSSSGGPPAAFSIATPRAAPQALDEQCLVFIRGFPSTQPGFILREYAAEGLALLPDSDQKLVRLRVAPADDMFSMVFPSPAKAASFVECYRALNMVFVAPDKSTHPLTCRTGKPIALRRRGGLIRPVYAALEKILGGMVSMATASISQTSKMRNGVMGTSFALRGRDLAPLFSLTFHESPEAMQITELTPAIGGPLSDTDLAALRAVAMEA